MNIREALRALSPSLQLQRSAGDEIARLDAQLNDAHELVVQLQRELSTYREREKTIGWAAV